MKTEITSRELSSHHFFPLLASRKPGFAATGESTSESWNLYRHHYPKYVPGSPLVANGSMSVR